MERVAGPGSLHVCLRLCCPHPRPNGLTFRTPSSQRKPSPRIQNPVPSWVRWASEDDSGAARLGADCQIPLAPAATQNRTPGATQNGTPGVGRVSFGKEATVRSSSRPARSSLWRVSGGGVWFSACGPCAPAHKHDRETTGSAGSLTALHGPCVGRPLLERKPGPAPPWESLHCRAPPHPPRWGRFVRDRGMCVCKWWPGLTLASAVSPERHT